MIAKRENKFDVNYINFTSNLFMVTKLFFKRKKLNHSWSKNTLSKNNFKNFKSLKIVQKGFLAFKNEKKFDSFY